MSDIMSRESFRRLIGQVRCNGAVPDDPLLAVYDALCVRLAELEQYLDTLRQAMYRAVEREHEAKRQLAQAEQERDHYRSCYQQVCKPDTLWQTNERQAKLLAAAQAEIARLKGVQPCNGS